MSDFKTTKTVCRILDGFCHNPFALQNGRPIYRSVLHEHWWSKMICGTLWSDRSQPHASLSLSLSSQYIYYFTSRRFRVAYGSWAGVRPQTGRRTNSETGDLRSRIYGISEFDCISRSKYYTHEATKIHELNDQEACVTYHKQNCIAQQPCCKGHLTSNFSLFPVRTTLLAHYTFNSFKTENFFLFQKIVLLDSNI